MRHDPLLFKKIKNIPISVIKREVASVLDIDIIMLDKPDHYPNIRLREYVTARQISMKLSKKYTTKSLRVIGEEHGDRDHATVLHACKTLDNLIDTKDRQLTESFNDAENKIKQWLNISEERRIGISRKDKANLIKHWIKCHVPLFVRQRKLEDLKHICSYCNQPIRKNRRI